MSFVYALKLMCDLYHYYALIALIGLLGVTSDFLMLVPLLLSIGAGIGYALAGRGEKARYLPLLLALAVVPFRPTRADIILSLPTVIYSVMYVKGNRRATDYYYAYERFKHGLIAVGVVLFMTLINEAGSFGAAVPSLFLHLALSITLLRMLRHENHVIRQKKFQILNLLGVVGMCAVGVALSTQWVLGLLRKGLNLLVDWVLMPALEVLAWILNLILTVVNWLGSLIPWKAEQGPAMNGGMMEGFSGEGGISVETVQEAIASPLLKQILEIAGIVALCVGGFFLLRVLSRQAGRMPELEKKEERESLDQPGSLKDAVGNLFRRRGDPVLGVRYTYQKFLKMAEGKNIPLNGCQNSLQIRDLSQEDFDETALDDLRAVYIRARYDSDASAESLAQAKDALSRLKKQ